MRSNITRMAEPHRIVDRGREGGRGYGSNNWYGEQSAAHTICFYRLEHHHVERIVLLLQRRTGRQHGRTIACNCG